MSWMKRRGQPSPNPNQTTNPPVQIYNPNQHSNNQPQQQQQQQPHQQWMQNPQQYNNDWYNQSRITNKTPPTQQQQQQPPQQYVHSNTTNYWQQQQQQPSYNQPPTSQYQHYNQYPNNQQSNYYQQPQNYYQNQSHNVEQYQQHQQPTSLNSNQNQNEADSWNWDWDENTNSNPATTQSQNENVSQSNIAEIFTNDESWNWSVEDTNSSQSASRSDSTQGESAIHAIKPEQKNVENIEKSLQDLTLNTQFENKEIVSPEMHPTPGPTPPPPPPAKKTQPETDKNPYKRTTALSHKSINSKLNLSKEPTDTFLQSTSTFVPPCGTDNLGVNLETFPDNSERPDLPVENVQKSVRKTSAIQWSENCEVAPINDRNQYLETGQLSDADVVFYNQSENTQSTSGDNNDSLPPPGLSRLVLGQIEQSDDNQIGDNALDDEPPPPGLSRMVLGSMKAEPQTIYPEPETSAADYQLNEEPPAGLHRMVPGESSSPETSSYLFQTDTVVFQPVNFDDTSNYVSESELNQMGVNLVSQRSATIGADTPPVTSQQTILNTAYSSSSSIDRISSREGAVGIDRDDQESSNINTNTLDENNSTNDNNRRETIDGGPPEEITPMIQNTSNGNQDTKHRSRIYPIDNDSEQVSPTGRYDKDRRYYEDRRDKHRDSPDRYRDDKRFERRRGKERRYEDDTDYYSDKERNERRNRDDRDDYEKRYSSLRREKDRDRRHKKEYERSDRRNDYYYNRYEEDYYNRSRPSSRSDSLHDSYRERNHRSHQEPDRSTRQHDRDRDRDHQRRPKDPYNPYYQGYNYDSYNPYYQYQYQYYENMRRTNPQAYAEWYRKYCQSQGGAMPHVPGYNTEDRASVHSGRSSANEELNKDRYTRQSYYSQQSLPHYYRDLTNANASTVYTVDDSRLLDHTDSSLILEDNNTISQRLTPTKFSTAHVKATISSGYFVNILPHYPLDGQPATLELMNIQNLLVHDEEQKELAEFPGPLTKGVSHKKTVIDYCENKIKRAPISNHDVESYVLMWELLILLLRQNGMVVGTDIAELLMKNRTCENSRRPSMSSASSSQHIDTVTDSIEQHHIASVHNKEEYITDKFREYLIYGSGKEALEWAMKHGLWGHALFLASKLDKRTYANVMMRFANGLTMNDPLQTLYQLLSGRQPAAVTCIADEKWGDWRPHLAMILSNTTQRPDLDRKAITTLGDTLYSRGSLYAAHFCYLMAQVEFGRYGAPNVKLVLLSSSHQQKSFGAFATNEAIFMTEIYEYACSLSDPAFVIPEFQPYKYLIATRMVDHGLLEKALLYLERLADNIKQDPIRFQPSLVSQVCELADRLKYCDPVEDDLDLDHNRADTLWLHDLKSVLNDYNMGRIIHQSATNLTSLEPEIQQNEYTLVGQQQQQADYYQQTQVEQQSWQPDEQNVDYNQQQLSYQESEYQQPNYGQNNYQEQYWNQQQQQQWDENVENKNVQQIDDRPPMDYWNSTTAQNEPTDVKKEIKPDGVVQQPKITLPNQSSSKNYFHETETEKELNSSNKKQQTPVKPKPASSTGWFGGIWSKLALRPKNQMKLPDDKNPSIVWDSEKKRWVNLEEDTGDASTELKPPPKMNELPNRSPSGPMSLPNLPITTKPVSLSSIIQNNNQTTPNIEPHPVNGNNNAAPPAENEGSIPISSSQPNMFKLQRSRNIKKAYVDVFNPGGTSTGTKNPLVASEVFGLVPNNNETGQHMNLFVPQPVNDPNVPTDFLTTHSNNNTEDNTQLSRWSSSSSLSREVQSYMHHRPRKWKNGGAPMMYNPNQFSNQSALNSGPQGRYQNH